MPFRGRYRNKRCTKYNTNYENADSRKDLSSYNKNIKKISRFIHNYKLRKPILLKHPKVTQLYEKKSLNRKKRSIEHTQNNYIKVMDNSVDTTENSDMNDVWQSIVELDQNTALLRDYNRNMNIVERNLIKAKENIFNHVEPQANQSSTEKVTISPIEFTTKTNIESLFVDAIPKIQTVMTNGLKRAENFTGSIEDLIENFDEESIDENTDQSSASELPDTEEKYDERLSKNVFQSVARSIKKIFGFFSNLAKVIVN